MYQPARKRRSSTLWALAVVALGYGLWLYFRHTFTGSTLLDASIGVVLGLFICSRPVGNMLDIILFGRVMRSQFTSQREEILWLALNALVLLAGLVVITTGTTRFAAPLR